MRHQDQVDQARKLLSYLDTRTTAMADNPYRHPVSDYTCPRQAALEREVFLRGESAANRVPGEESAD
jgi:hypothetical protein